MILVYLRQCVRPCTEEGQMIQLDQVVTEKSSGTKSTEKVAYPDWRVWGNKDEFRKDTWE